MKASYLYSCFRIQSPSPWYLEKSQISYSMALNRAASEKGSFFENCSKISWVVACPFAFPWRAIKSLISLKSLLWVWSWEEQAPPTPPSPPSGVVWVFLSLILARRTFDEVFTEPNVLLLPGSLVVVVPLKCCCCCCCKVRSVEVCNCTHRSHSVITHLSWQYH